MPAKKKTIFPLCIKKKKYYKKERYNRKEVENVFLRLFKIMMGGVNKKG